MRLSDRKRKDKSKLSLVTVKYGKYDINKKGMNAQDHCPFHMSPKLINGKVWIHVGSGEPTGQSVSFQGASIVRLEGDKIRSDHAYFDRKGLDEQLALK